MGTYDSVDLYREIRLRWHFQYKLWHTIHYALGVLAILLSCLMAARPVPAERLPDHTYNVLACVLAVVTGVITFVSPWSKGSRYRRAWLLLSSAITRYDSDFHASPEGVIEVHELGERIIHNEAGSDDPASLVNSSA